MKKLLSSALALTLVAAGPALAKPHDDDGGGGKKNRGESHQGGGGGNGGGHQNQGGGNGGGGHQNRGDRGDRGGNNGGGGGHQNRGIGSGNNPGQHNGWRNNPNNAAAQKSRGGDNDRRGDRNRGDNYRGNDRLRNAGPNHGYRNDGRRGDVNVNVRLGGGGGGGYRWNNPAHRNYFASRWNGRARNFNYQAYRRAFVNPRRYRIGAYYRPSGWYYRRWGVGAYFPSLFWSSNYWLNDWGSYGLMSPPWGYEWVRYGNDAVLVDVRTGQILQVRYDIFW